MLRTFDMNDGIIKEIPVENKGIKLDISSAVSIDAHEPDEQ